MYGGCAMEHFGGSAPDHHQAAGAGGFAELRDVIHQRGRLVHLAALGLHVGPVDAADVFGIEHRFHRLDRRERFLQLREQRGLQHLGVDGSFVSGVFVNIPATENQVVKTSQWHKVFDLWRAPIGAFPQADGRKLRERANRESESAFDCFHTCDEGGGNGSDPGDQDAKLTFGGRNLDVIFGGQNFSAPKWIGQDFFGE